jgi:VWFA-related protein
MTRPVVITCAVACTAVAGVAQQAPTFRSSADVIAVDVQVVSRDGMPITGLTAEQFEVFIDGRRRPVQSAQFLRVAEPPPVPSKRGAPPEAPTPRAPVSGDGRIIMIAVDQMSFPVSAQQSAREAARRVAAGVAPGDYLGMMTVPGDVRIAPTRDRAAIEEGIKRIGGLRGDLKSSKFNISASEASLIKSNDPMTMAEVFKRECERMFTDPTCKQEVRQDAAAIANALEQQGLTAVNGLHDVVDALESVPGRKTLIVISAGIPISRKTGGQPNLDHELARISRRAAAANINLYVFYMNVHFLRYFSAEYGRQNHTIFDDITMFGYGLEKFADAAGGSFAQVEVDADPFVDRIMRETSAYYLLAVPTEARDRDGKEYVIRVAVKGVRGAEIQYRKAVLVPSGK